MGAVRAERTGRRRNKKTLRDTTHMGMGRSAACKRITGRLAHCERVAKC